MQFALGLWTQKCREERKSDVPNIVNHTIYSTFHGDYLSSENGGSNFHQSTIEVICMKAVNVLIMLVGLISTINVYRGYWFLMDEYFMPNDYEQSLINGQIYGALVLFVLYAGCSLHAGIFKDEHVGGKCLVEFYYLTYFYLKVNFVKLPTATKFHLIRRYLNQSHIHITFFILFYLFYIRS